MTTFLLIAILAVCIRIVIRVGRIADGLVLLAGAVGSTATHVKQIRSKVLDLNPDLDL